jgi:hypothetical protein
MVWGFNFVATIILALAICQKNCAFSPPSVSVSYNGAISRRTFTEVGGRNDLALNNLNEDIDAVMTEKSPFMMRKPTFGKGSGYNLKLSDLKDKLTNTGASGLVAYGFLNCIYYTVATAIVWFTVSSKEAGAAVEMGTGYMTKLKGNMAKFPKIMLLVWAGSQTTKMFRISGSIFLAPWASSLLKWMQRKLNISQSNAVAICSSALLSFTALFYAVLLVVATKMF